jgi:hypothetical protein
MIPLCQSPGILFSVRACECILIGCLQVLQVFKSEQKQNILYFLVMRQSSLFNTTLIWIIILKMKLLAVLYNSKVVDKIICMIRCFRNWSTMLHHYSCFRLQEEAYLSFKYEALNDILVLVWIFNKLHILIYILASCGGTISTHSIFSVTTTSKENLVFSTTCFDFI